MRFFFYGTLQAGNLNPAIAAIHGRLIPQGRARINGAIVAVPDAQGWFPALVPGDGEVHGQVYAAGPDFTAEDLAALDRYEEFDPASPETSWYLREVRTLISGESVMVYRMNGSPPAAAVPIPGGDFRAWLKAQNLREFQGRDQA